MSIDPTLYPSGLDHLLLTDALDVATFKSVLVKPGYVYDPAHVAIAALGANQVAQSDALTGLTVTAGLVTADNPVFHGVAGGLAVAGYVIWDSTNDKLVAYNGRLADGRPIDFTTTGGVITQMLSGGRLLRIGGAG